MKKINHEKHGDEKKNIHLYLTYQNPLEVSNAREKTGKLCFLEETLLSSQEQSFLKHDVIPLDFWSLGSQQSQPQVCIF